MSKSVCVKLLCMETSVRKNELCINAALGKVSACKSFGV